jgi:hypothetical protein
VKWTNPLIPIATTDGDQPRKETTAMDDDEFRTPEERQADEQERRQVAEVYQLERQLDDQQRGLEQLQQDDPVGLVWFGDRDSWVDKRLADARRQGDRP